MENNMRVLSVLLLGLTTTVAAEGLLTLQFAPSQKNLQRQVTLDQLDGDEVTKLAVDAGKPVQFSLKNNSHYRVSIATQGHSPSKFLVATKTDDAVAVNFTAACLLLQPKLKEIDWVWKDPAGKTVKGYAALKNGKAKIDIPMTARPLTLNMMGLTTTGYASVAGIDAPVVFDIWQESALIDAGYDRQTLQFDANRIPKCSANPVVKVQSSNAELARHVRESLDADTFGYWATHLTSVGQTKALKALLHAEEGKLGDPNINVVKHALTRLFEAQAFTDNVAKVALKVLPFSAPEWTYRSNALPTILNWDAPDSDEHGRYAQWRGRTEPQVMRAVAETKSHIAGLYCLLFFIENSLPHTDASTLADAIAMVKKRYKEEDYASELNNALTSESRNTSLVGNKVPAFQFKSMRNNETVSNEAMAGKVYLVDYWATWCKPCRDISPKIDRLYKKYKSPGLNIVSIALSDSRTVIDRWQQTHPMPWFNAVDAFESADALFNVKAIPALILVNKDGIVVGMYEESNFPELELKLTELLKR